MRILVAGIGSIGQRHIRNLRALLGPRVEILAYRTRHRKDVITERLEIEPGVNVNEFYGLRTYDCLNQALTERPEAVFVCNPTRLHVPVALEAVRAGCDVLIEKPLSHDYESVDELAELVERKDLVAMVGYQMRFHPALRRLHDLVCTRAVGRLLTVRIVVAEHLPDAHPYEDYRQSYAARAELGGGVIRSYIHELDYVYWLFGLPTRVFALGGRVGDLDVNVEDMASILMECLIDGRPVPVHVHQDFLQRLASRTCEVIGKEGRIMLDLNAPVLTVFDRSGQVVERCTFTGFERNQLFLDELRHFLTCVEGREPPAVTVRDGAQSLRIALAAIESLRAGQVVELSP